MAVVTQPRSSGASEPAFPGTPPEADIELWWLPLGAGGWFVRLNGRIYEAIHAFLERRRPLDLYHSALQVRLPEGRVVIENSWPIPDADPATRGVVVQGPVGSRRLVRWRVRYEVRRWRDRVIADADQAVASPQRLSDDPRLARRLLDLVGSLPTRSGAETSSGQVRCGIPTSLSPGCSPAAASQWRRSSLRPVAARQDGRRASSRPSASRARSGRLRTVRCRHHARGRAQEAVTARCAPQCRSSRPVVPTPASERR
jgi:hypothetical protein